MDPQLSTETLKNLTKDIYLCFSLYHKISVDDQFSNYHIYNNRKYSEITMMLHLNIESILKINCITPETNSLIHCININLPKTLPSDFFHNFSQEFLRILLLSNTISLPDTYFLFDMITSNIPITCHFLAERLSCNWSFSYKILQCTNNTLIHFCKNSLLHLILYKKNYSHLINSSNPPPHHMSMLFFFLLW